jgi:uncharacterized membrane protein (DUF485 family)
MEQSETNPDLNAEIKTVPSNLKTLGILSLIMGGLMILTVAWGLKKSFLPTEQDIADQQQQIEMAQKLNPEGGAELASKAIADQGTQGIIGLFCQIISVVGVILMLKLKKTGFYLYIFGELISYVFMIILFGFKGMIGIAGAMGDTFETIGWVVAGLMIVQDFVFIWLYSRQVKFMS